MLKKLLIAVTLVVGALILFVTLQPAEFRVTRSTTIVAPVVKVFEQVNDFYKWDGWSPWAKLDPNITKNFDGAPAGVGAFYSWSGNEQIGIKLEFTKPFAATNRTEFSFRPEAEKTQVTWSMSGSNNFMVKAFSLFMNMDKMVGGDFEKGLAQLKSISEATPK